MAPLDRSTTIDLPSPKAAPSLRMGRAEWAMLGLLALIWGSAFLFIKVAVAAFDPLTYVWIRLVIAATALAVILRVSGHRLRLPATVWASVGVLALLNNVVPFLLFGWGTQHIASGLAAILQATTPIFGVLAAHVATTDERLTRARLIGVTVGFGGVAAMIGPQIAGDGGNHLLAQLACLFASLLYALAGIFARRFKALGVNPMQLAAAQFIAGAIMLAPVALLFGQSLATLPSSWEAWGSVVTLSLLCSALAYIIFFRLIERAGATNSLLVTLLVPPVAIVVGSIVLGEHLALNQLSGLLLIAGGLAIIDGRVVAAARGRFSRR
ncbi:DMT family transporter [Sphingomonas jaspsi]|uniref:DMT family transporter n=1 Tax=Sphingomonas jaspsi TaxID=392409 RepID=UPI0004BB8D34|nr:DMT family transporter [Sphingomonas jaspsi]